MQKIVRSVAQIGNANAKPFRDGSGVRRMADPLQGAGSTELGVA